MVICNTSFRIFHYLFFSFFFFSFFLAFFSMNATIKKKNKKNDRKRIMLSSEFCFFCPVQIVRKTFFGIGVFFWSFFGVFLLSSQPQKDSWQIKRTEIVVLPRIRICFGSSATATQESGITRCYLTILCGGYKQGWVS